jgi:cation:H+ antiporter
VTLVLGITAIVGKKLFIHGKVLTKTMMLVLSVSLLPLILGFDGTLSRVDGIILISGFLFYIYSLLRKEGQMGKIKKDVKWSEIWKDMVVITISIIVLLIASNFLITSARFIGGIIGIPDILLGLVLVAIGTTIPELTVEVQSVLRGVSGIAFGDILGSVVCNSSLVLGVAALLNPITIPKYNFILFRDSALFMVTAIYIALLFIKKKKITWEEGIGLIMVYATFVVTTFF